MSSIATLIIVLPIMVGCLIAAAIDIGARIHGGWATPTPVVDLACVAGRAARAALIAIPAATIVGTNRAARGGRA